MKLCVKTDTLRNDDVSQCFMEIYAKMALMERTVQNLMDMKGNFDLELTELEQLIQENKQSKS